MPPLFRLEACHIAAQVIPLEMLPAGEFDLVYRSPLDPRSGELPVLPLSITGALAMAKPQDPAAAADGYVAADQVGTGKRSQFPCSTVSYYVYDGREVKPFRSYLVFNTLRLHCHEYSDHTLRRHLPSASLNTAVLQVECCRAAATSR